MGMIRLALEALELVYHACLVGGLEDGAAGYEHIGSGLYEAAACLHIDASIDFDEGLRTGGIDEAAELTHLLDGVLDKLLSAKAGIHGHEEHHVDIADDIGEHAHGGAGVEGDACLHACLVYLVDDATDVGTGFVVYIHHHGAQGFDLGDELLGLHNHKVHVEGLLAEAGYMLKHGKTEGDVGDKHAIHHVEVEPVGLTAVDHIYIACQVGEIGSQQRRGNHRTHIYNTTDNLMKQC